MITHANAMSDSGMGAQKSAVGEISAWQTFYWSVRREFWENRSLYLAPLIVASVALIAFSISTILGIGETPLRFIPAQHRAPFDMSAGMLMATLIIVSVFYSIDALYGERRDRSVQFWKSLPVSDTTTVLAKASIPLIVLPLLTFVVTVAMQWLMLLVSSAVLLVRGQSVAMLWASLSIPNMWLVLAYHLATAHALWPFPIYCWLLLVSGWAKRAVFLWAALPVLGIAAVEGIMLRTSRFVQFIGLRLIGDAPAMSMAPDSMGLDPHSTHLTVGRFLSSPGLWLGFLVAAVFLAAAIRLRRYQSAI